ncbi:FRG domain-containing protein [Rubritalea sp.]|uniref:FRG domain-containing protein n=1 Tax=Rubritalea sp. TaxID=2109375 RepID=UPI003EF7B4F3
MTTNKLSIRDYREIYEEWCSLKNWEYGPVFSSSYPERFEQLTKQLTQQLDLNNEIWKENHVHLPSPWHASFFLSLLQNTSISSKTTHFLFRGHSDSSWRLTPTIDRHPKKTFERFMGTLEYIILNELLANLHMDLTMLGGRNNNLNFSITLPREAYSAVCQHYGSATPLLDFTADPSTAVFFATQRKTSKGSKNSRVFVVRLDGAADNPNKFHLKLVPPFFNRPYLQKGVFIESQEEDDVAESFTPDLTVDFPYSDINQEFSVIRGNKIDLLPELDSMNILKKLAKKGAAEFVADNLGENVGYEQMLDFSFQYAKANDDTLTPLFKDHIKDPFKYFFAFIEEIEDMLYWLCYHVGPKNGKNEIGVNLNVLELIIKDNPEIMNFVSQMYSFYMLTPGIYQSLEPDKKEWITAINSNIRIYLSKHGHDPDQKVDFESCFGHMFSKK